MATEESKGKTFDEPTATWTVGHEWDGIEELDTPMPRWWLWTLYLTIVWGIIYVILYPAWPLVNQATEGVLGWSSRGQLAEQMAEETERRAPLMAALAQVPIERLPEDSELMRAAITGGRAAFRVNCVQCHGAGAAGSEGYPNLNDDDWLWGGDLKAIEYTITHGVRDRTNPETRFSQMPAFGRDGLLTPEQISDVTDYVLTLSGRAEVNRAAASGAELYAGNCAICHGNDGTGSREFGAPNLADAIWLFGSEREVIRQRIHDPMHGVMPAWGGRLDSVTIKMLAAYVHSLGGGEDFVEVAQDPAVEVDEQP